MKDLSKQVSWYSSTKPRMCGSLSTNKSNLILILSSKSNELINWKVISKLLWKFTLVVLRLVLNWLSWPTTSCLGKPLETPFVCFLLKSLLKSSALNFLRIQQECPPHYGSELSLVPFLDLSCPSTTEWFALITKIFIMLSETFVEEIIHQTRIYSCIKLQGSLMTDAILLHDNQQSLV